MMLFGLPFAAVGVFMLWSLVTTLADYNSAKEWVRKRATILSTELERRHGGEGGSRVSVVAEYRYHFGGKRFKSDRIGISSFQEQSAAVKRHRRLKRLLNKPGKATCFVNPDDPTQVVLDRSLPLTVVLFHVPFVLCFGGAGLGMIGAGAFLLLRRWRRRARLAASPGEPWRIRKDWTAGVVRCGGWSGAAGLGLFALFWNALSVPIFALVVTNDNQQPGWVVLLVGLFPLIGLGLLGGALWQAFRVLRFGRSTFRLAGVPGVIGGELAGVVLAPAGVVTKGGYRITLACGEQVTEKRGSEYTLTTNELWKDSRVVDRTLHDPSGKRGVPVRFVIPTDSKPTDPEAPEPISWKLTVTADTRGPDYHAEFDVPVYRTESSRDGVVADSAPLTEYEREEGLEEALAQEGVRVSLGASALQLTCPPCRHPLTALLCLGMGVVLGGVGVGLFLYLDEWVKWIVAPAFAFFGVLLGYVGLDLLLSCTDLTITGDRWRLRSGWYGLRGAGREFTSDQVRGITTKQAMSSTSGSGPTKKWNNVVVRISSGDKLTLVRSLESRHAEGLLMEELKRRAGSG
ncbi:MAG: DUF3592 domain-containing protein [Planctomycetota bacterium]